MQVLSQLVHSQQRICLLSIHQPSSRVFQSLDNLLLLSHGEVAYYGAVSAASGTVEALGLSCPVGVNIAEHLLDVVSHEHSRKTLLNAHRKKGVLVKQEVDCCDSHLPNGQPRLPLAGTPCRVLTVELPLLCWRAALDTIRCPGLLRLHVVVSAVLAAVAGMAFQGVENDIAGFQNYAGSIFFVMVFFGFGALSAIELFVASRTLFERELQTGYYTSLPLFLAKATLDILILRVIPATVFAIIFYPLMGLSPTASAFGIYVLTLALVNTVCALMCMTVSIAAPSVGSANFLATMATLILELFSGALLNTASMPSFLRWLASISHFWYGFELLLTSQLAGKTILINAPGVPAVIVKADVFFGVLGLDPERKKTDFFWLGMLALGWAVIAYSLLLIKMMCRKAKCCDCIPAHQRPLKRKSIPSHTSSPEAVHTLQIELDGSDDPTVRI